MQTSTDTNTSSGLNFLQKTTETTWWCMIPIWTKWETWADSGVIPLTRRMLSFIMTNTLTITRVMIYREFTTLWRMWLCGLLSSFPSFVLLAWPYLFLGFGIYDANIRSGERKEGKRKLQERRNLRNRWRLNLILRIRFVTFVMNSNAIRSWCAVMPFTSIGWGSSLLTSETNAQPAAES